MLSSNATIKVECWLIVKSHMACGMLSGLKYGPKLKIKPDPKLGLI